MGKVLCCYRIWAKLCGIVAFSRIAVDVTSRKLDLGSMCQIGKFFAKLFVEGRFALSWGAARGARQIQQSSSSAWGAKLGSWETLKKLWIMGKKIKCGKIFFFCFFIPFLLCCYNFLLACSIRKNVK